MPFKENKCGLIFLLNEKRKKGILVIYFLLRISSPTIAIAMIMAIAEPITVVVVVLFIESRLIPVGVGDAAPASITLT